jgi:hydrogenase expression/formation protein HypD
VRVFNYRDKLRDPQDILALVEQIRGLLTRSWTIMEVCGGQTHAILTNGLDQLLPPEIKFVHGPGCPVCVTPIHRIDQAIELAGRPEVILCSLGDMLRVPGSDGDLLAAKAAGADVRIVYSPLDSVAVARDNPDRQIVYFAIGFETTAPLNALAILQAKQSGLTNYSALVAQVLVPPAIKSILSDPERRINALLAAGHVCTVMGYTEYETIANDYSVPIVVTGFEPIDILQGTLAAIVQLESGQAQLVNGYRRAVQREGNLEAQDLMRQVFEVVDSEWRGLDVIKKSGLAIKPEFSSFDAEQRFELDEAVTAPNGDCLAGKVLLGKIQPDMCPSFGRDCKPEHPLGAPMVSAEGACAAYYSAGRGAARQLERGE